MIIKINGIVVNDVNSNKQFTDTTNATKTNYDHRAELKQLKDNLRISKIVSLDDWKLVRDIAV